MKETIKQYDEYGACFEPFGRSVDNRVVSDAKTQRLCRNTGKCWMRREDKKWLRIVKVLGHSLFVEKSGESYEIVH